MRRNERKKGKKGEENKIYIKKSKDLNQMK